MIKPYEDLANGIVLQAVKDYRQAMKSGHQAMQVSLEKFFRSPWFSILTAIDADRLIARLKEEKA